jgi:hypothetical protein
MRVEEQSVGLLANVAEQAAYAICLLRGEAAL